MPTIAMINIVKSFILFIYVCIYLLQNTVRAWTLARSRTNSQYLLLMREIKVNLGKNVFAAITSGLHGIVSFQNSQCSR